MQSMWKLHLNNISIKIRSYKNGLKTGETTLLQAEQINQKSNQPCNQPPSPEDMR